MGVGMIIERLNTITARRVILRQPEENLLRRFDDMKRTD